LHTTLLFLQFIDLKKKHTMKNKILSMMASAMFCLSIGACTKSSTTTNPSTSGIKTFSGQMQCIWDESKMPNPKAFLDLDNGIVYDVNTAPAHAADIDLIWSECSGGSIIQSPNTYYDAFAPSSSTSPNFQTAVLFANWGQRNQTSIDSKSSQTVAQFTAITNNTELLALMADNFDFSSSQWDFMECTSAHFNKIYYV
jgi:hypothetical protein